MNGFADHTLDLIVETQDASAVLVDIEAGPGIDYLAFRRATYSTL